jgi:hypothetical protein
MIGYRNARLNDIASGWIVGAGYEYALGYGWFGKPLG